MRKLNVMVVDDSMIMIRNLTQMINKMGHEVVLTAKNGTKAIYLLNDSDMPKVDIITMDINMPIMDGIETTKRILKKNSKALIVMVTSHGQEQMVVEAVTNGAKAYVLKPVNSEHLRSVLESVYNKYGNK